MKPKNKKKAEKTEKAAPKIQQTKIAVTKI